MNLYILRKKSIPINPLDVIKSLDMVEYVATFSLDIFDVEQLLMISTKQF